MKFYITLPDPESARGDNPALSFTANGHDTFAEQLQHALSDRRFVENWLAGMDEDKADQVDPALLAIDAKAKVSAKQHGLGFMLIADTVLNGAAFKHRMRQLAGTHWQLVDVK
ncbi:hypothetical protein [Arenimonas sp.]|jgi:hypothetical protein|uniref:hypothetical protein n=1 Tax=Arenimonas sp. TaxID=1872635 RepID=UPI0037BED7FD